MTYSPIDPLRTALKAIIVRCEEGDRRTNWLSTIAGIARAGLEAHEPFRLSCEHDCVGPCSNPVVVKMSGAPDAPKWLVEYHEPRSFLDPDPRYVEPLPETGYYDEPPRRVSVIWLLGLVVVAAVVIGAVMVRAR